MDQVNILYPNEREAVKDLWSSYSVLPSEESHIIGDNLRVCKLIIHVLNAMELTFDFDHPRLRRSQGGRGEFGVEVDYFPEDQDDEDDLRRLVDMRERTTRGGGGGGRIGDEGGSVDGGEGYSSRLSSLAGVGLHLLEVLLCWYG